MNRKTFLIIIVTLFVVVSIGLVGGYFYLTNTKAPEVPQITGGTGSLVESTTNSTERPNTETPTSTVGTIIPRIRQISTSPIAGYDFVDTAPKGYVIWYVDRATGHIFQTATSTLAVNRITNTTIPKVYEAHIGKGGANVILRSLSDSTNTIQTYLATPKIASSSLIGVFTADTISHLSLSPLKDRFYGMTSTASGLGNIYSWAAKSTNIFSHPLKKWIPQWVNTNTILMTSAPSAKTQNVAYFLNPVNKALTKVLGPRNGLVISSSPDATRLLFSENKGNTLSFGLYNVKTEVETPISNATIPDKCVWSKKDPSIAYCGFPKSISGIFPDDWYQGKTLFNDTLRGLDVDTFNFETISDLQSETGQQIDAINLMLSSDEKYILFTNKRDLTLWMIEL